MRLWPWGRKASAASPRPEGMPAPPPGVGPAPDAAEVAKTAARNAVRFWRSVADSARAHGDRPKVKLRSKAFNIPDPYPGVISKTANKPQPMAMDSAISNVYSFAAGAEWAGDGFIGYPLLSELALIPEFRTPCAQIANAMTGQWGKVISTSQDGDKAQISEKLQKIEAELKRLNAQELFRWAFETDGQMGLAKLWIDLGNRADIEELRMPFNPRMKIKKGGLKGLIPIEPYFCYPNQYNTTDPLAANFYRPDTWFVYQKEVHSTRFLNFNSRPVRDILKPAYLFGGQSLIELMWVVVENWMRTRQSVSDLTHAFSVMCLMTDLAQGLSPAESADLLDARAQGFNLLRDNLGLFVLNRATEDFKNISAPLASLDKLQAQSQEHMTAVSLIPLVVAFGITPTGLNASSESEMQVWDSNINSMQERIGTPNMLTLLQCVQMSLFEEIDDSIGWQWNPLRQLTGKEQAELQKSMADMFGALMDRGVVSAIEVRKVLASSEDGPWSNLDVDDLPEQPHDPESEGDPMNEPDDARHGMGAADLALDDSAWNEGQHPRAENGQFGSGGSSAHAGPVGEGAREHTGVRGGVDKGEAASINHYTAAGFKSINWGLRGIRQHTPETTAHLAELDRVMSRASLPEPMVVHRGIGGNGLKEILKLGLKKGSIIPDPGFLSTSKSSGVGKSFQNSSDNIMLEIRLPKGARAVDLGKLSDNPGEQEVLLDRNSKLKVVSFNSKTKTAVMELVQ